MPRILTGAGILVAFSIAPALAFAAYDDVTLTTDAVLSVNGITLNITGSNAVIQSIAVSDTDFTVVLPSGSNFQVTAPGLQKLVPSTRTSLVKETCTGTQSILGYAPVNADVTVTITPSTSLVCSAGGHSSSSGGGTTHVIPAVPAVPATHLGGCVPGSGDLFDVTSGKSCTVRAIPATSAFPASLSSAAGRSFKSDLTVGSLGNDVKSLQQFLNAHGYRIASSGPGSSGNETDTFGRLTRAALVKYQKAKGITPAVGYFGPKTRASINAEQ